MVDNVVQGGVDDFRDSYEYDALYRLTSVTQGGAAVADKQVTFGYDLAGQLTDVRRLAQNQLVAHSRHDYDLAGRLTGIRHADAEITAGWDGTAFPTNPTACGCDTIAAYSLDYDAGNRLESLSSWRDQFVVDYVHDNRNQPRAADYRHGTGVTAPFLPADESYEFDGNGNRALANGQTYTTGADNRLTSIVSGVSFEYDKEGNRTKKTNPDNSFIDFVWDFRNRLAAVIEHNGSGTVVRRVEYANDVFNRRIGKKVDDDGDGDFDSATTWVYDGPHIALAITDADGDGSAAPRLSNRYLHGPAIDMILADEQITAAGEAGDVYWPLTDHLGSVRDVIDSAGVVENHLVYDSFGNKLSGATSTENVDFLFGYTGRDWDEDVDLQYNRARWYDPSVGRWLSEDPSGFGGGDANLYRYVGNTSTTANDPSGLEQDLITQEGVGHDGIHEGKGRLSWRARPGNCLSDLFLFDPRTDYRHEPGMFEWIVVNLAIRTGARDLVERELVIFYDPLKGIKNKIKDLTAASAAEAIVQTAWNWDRLSELDKQDIPAKVASGIVACRVIGTIAPRGAPSNIGPRSAKAPRNVSPGVRELEGHYVDDLGRVQPWRAHYDEYGRLIGRTDYNAGNRAAKIPDTHYERWEYNSQYPLGRKFENHMPGEFPQ